MNWFDFVVLSLVTWRITRFSSLDSLIEEPRDWIVKWTLRGDTYVEDDEEWPFSWWKRKIKQWIDCPWCQSVWVAAGVVGFWCLISSDWPGWNFLLLWLAVSGAAMIPYRFADPAPPCLPRKPCD